LKCFVKQSFSYKTNIKQDKVRFYPPGIYVDFCTPAPKSYWTGMDFKNVREMNFIGEIPDSTNPGVQVPKLFIARAVAFFRPNTLLG